MPVLAVGPVVDQHGEAANLAERKLALIRRWVSPNAAVTAIETAGSAIVGSTVWHKTQFSWLRGMDRKILVQKFNWQSDGSQFSLIPVEEIRLFYPNETV